MVELTTIEDPVQGIKYCNTQMGRIEAIIEKLGPDIEPKLFNSLSYNLREWTELCEKFIHEAHRQGKMTTDITKGTDKKRFVAKA